MMSDFNFLKNQQTSVSMKKLTLLLLIVFFTKSIFAQLTPYPTAITNPLILAFPLDVSSCGSVAFNPVTGLYYTSRVGNSTYPLLTFKHDGTLLFQDVAGQDTRGIWWNPNTNQLERNCFSAIGWAQIVLDGANNATSAFNVIFAGALSPNAQCEGAYDPVNNEVVFYNASSISKYNRTTGALISTTAITGVTFGSINTTAVIYTGVTGYEYGILDYTAKKVILLNRATCAYAGESALPAAAVTAVSHQFSYANNLLWLFNTTDNKWYSYQIFDLPVLAIDDIILSGIAEPTQNTLSWEAISDSPIEIFNVLHSTDGVHFNLIGSVQGYDSGSGMYVYEHKNPSSTTNYYRIQCSDDLQEPYLSEIICIEAKNSNNSIALYPNPATTYLVINNPIVERKYTIMNASKQIVASGTLPAGGKVDVHQLESGMYFLTLDGTSYSFIKK